MDIQEMGFEQDMGCCGDFSCLIGSNLVLVILARLGIHDLFRVRCVCKSWYEAVLSPHFAKVLPDTDHVWAVLRVRTEKPQDEEQKESAVYNLESHAEVWYPLSTSIRRVCSFPMGPPGSMFMGLASSKGLVCGRLMEHEESITLVVGNPLLKMWKTLPPAPLSRIPPYMEHFLQVDPTLGTYSVVVLYYSTTEEEKYSVLQYDSKRDVWDTGRFSLGSSSGGQLKGCVVGIDSLCMEEEPYVLSYDPVYATWSHVYVPFPVFNDEDENWRGSRCTLSAGFRYMNRCILAASMWRVVEDEDEPVGLAVWELDEANATWKVVSKRRFKEVYGQRWSTNEGDMSWKTQLVGDVLVFSTRYKPWTHGLCAPVAYSLKDSTWESSVEETWSIDYECTYAFVPSLIARM